MPVPVGVESWIWYSIAMLAVSLRFTSRYVQLESLKRLQLEDYLMVLATCLYTILIVLLNIVSDVQTNLIAPEDLPTLDPKNIAERVRGSKMVLALETCMCSVIWLCKSCILLLYYKLTFGLKQHILVKATAAYVVGSFVVMMTLYFAVWCRPFSGYWETPSQNVQCTTATSHLITNFIFNLTSDLLIISIPLPLLLRSSLPLPKKIALTALFSVGVFIMICTILSKYYSFRQPFSPIWIYWYTREASTAMVVTNMTHVWTLVRRVFRLKSFTGSSERNGNGDGRAGGRDSRRGMVRYSASLGAVEEGAGARGGAGAGTEEEVGGRDKASSQQSQRGERLSVPFADIGNLLPSPHSPIAKSYSFSSVSRPSQKKRQLSSASASVDAETHLALKRPTSWLSPNSIAYTQSSKTYSNASALTAANGITPTRQPSSSQLPSSALPLNTIQLVRNPASFVDASRPRGRGLHRVDSITLLGLPDG